ncbi:tRNA epoxyqueuosine(34) reductase QueG [Thiorhodovibrio frisius]|uniref:Epoxyqueuosine reductase n=1 Tax=Thiorhodovibrio frisius TaxID=631362 RepID=H8Z510_9GAMM|nr:tRNA epoxyqueuosine(34) reductase QueG [Thiorhodovibrio frisius]EIC20417.1 iron-sulfur cluster binding protein, putative [Thiorhodovibrio frisius]WPL21158.1 Epoxyqueuosine reductase [Thiorhodovibrio frisius]
MTPTTLAAHIKTWGRELGFQQVGIAGCELSGPESYLHDWLARGWHGEMDYMARHGSKRSRPAELLPGTKRVICARMDYMPEALEDTRAACDHPIEAFISRYALGRDYHKLLRARLKQLALRIEAESGPFQWRPLVDSAPVMEKPLAQAAGLGWIGKHTNLINPGAGSWFFLGELYVDLLLPIDEPLPSHCGRCRACMDICPTGAIVKPYELDARLCISYLTIELAGAIPAPLRPLLGNRIYGCDDCQLVCPWNRFAHVTKEADFCPRHGLDGASLIALFSWDEAEFLKRTEGSAIRRIGHQRWLRNIAVALGNAAPSPVARQALEARSDHPSDLIREHVHWALARQCQRRENDDLSEKAPGTPSSQQEPRA